jgi:hypothetical protein
MPIFFEFSKKFSTLKPCPGPEVEFAYGEILDLELDLVYQPIGFGLAKPEPDYGDSRISIGGS